MALGLLRVCEMTASTTTIDVPDLSDAAAMWRIAADCGLDRNSAYKYLLFCRDFCHTSAVARVGDETAGFVTGYRRPGSDTLFIWQVGVLDRFRKRGLALNMLAEIQRRGPSPLAYVEATVTPDNAASWRLFRGFAEQVGAPCEEHELFGSELFPHHHEPEVLIRIGPIRTASADQRLTTQEGGA